MSENAQGKMKRAKGKLNITLMGTLKNGGTFEHIYALVNGLFVASRLFCEVRPF
jgi:hypothetical protein